MKSWKSRLGLVLTMLAMVLAVSMPAVADDVEDYLEDEFAGEVEVEDVDCDGIEDEEDESIEEEVDCTVTLGLNGEEVEVFLQDVDADGINDDEDEDGEDDGINDDDE
jgi:hypothetical protein